MSSTFREVLKQSLDQKVDLRRAALVAAVRRVTGAMLVRGLYPQ
jgi:glutamate dehydrogenase/leucine dehydrogenase